MQTNNLDGLAEAIFGLQHVVRGGVYRTQFLAELGRKEDLGILRVLRAVQRCSEDEPSIGAVASYLGIGLSTASRLVDRPVNAGLVVRKAAAEDRRRTHLELTPSGEALLADASRSHERVLLRATAEWSPDEVKVFIDLTKRMIDDLNGLGPA